jgi:hypothetical protein
MIERCTRLIRLRDGVIERDEPAAMASRLEKAA